MWGFQMVIQEKLDVGTRIRKLREGKGHSLRVLAESSGLSINAISRIERGDNSPTVSSLHMIAKALKVPISAFFSDGLEQITNFVHRTNRLRYEESGVIMESLGAGLQDQQMEPFIMTINHKGNAQTNTITHSGEKCFYCLKGEVECCVGKRIYQLKPGDSLLFKATQPHWCRKITQFPPELLVVFVCTQESDLAQQRQIGMHSKSA